MLNLIKSFWADESGQALVEYAVMLALIAIAVVAAVIYFRDKIIDVFRSSADQIPTAAPTTTP